MKREWRRGMKRKKKERLENRHRVRVRKRKEELRKTNLEFILVLDHKRLSSHNGRCIAREERQATTEPGIQMWRTALENVNIRSFPLGQRLHETQELSQK